MPLLKIREIKTLKYSKYMIEINKVYNNAESVLLRCKYFKTTNYEQNNILSPSIKYIFGAINKVYKEYRGKIVSLFPNSCISLSGNRRLDLFPINKV